MIHAVIQNHIARESESAAWLADKCSNHVRWIHSGLLCMSTKTVIFTLSVWFILQDKHQFSLLEMKLMKQDISNEKAFSVTFFFLHSVVGVSRDSQV